MWKLPHVRRGKMRRKERKWGTTEFLSLALCVMRLPHKWQFSLIPWGNEEQLTCSLKCIWVSCHDRMRSWIKGLLGSDWIWEFCELLWSHYTLCDCHLRLSLKFQTCSWTKITQNYWEKNKPLPCDVVHEERSEWLSKMDHQQERDWWGETRSDASSIQ